MLESDSNLKNKPARRACESLSMPPAWGLQLSDQVVVTFTCPSVKVVGVAPEASSFAVHNLFDTSGQRAADKPARKLLQIETRANVRYIVRDHPLRLQQVERGVFLNYLDIHLRYLLQERT